MIFQDKVDYRGWHVMSPRENLITKKNLFLISITSPQRFVVDFLALTFDHLEVAIDLSFGN